MIDYRLSNVAAPTDAEQDFFREFLASNGGESDDCLAVILKRAMMAVQDWEDRTLLAGTATIVATGREDGDEPVLLYGTPDEIQSVTGPDGSALEYSLIGKTLLPSCRTPALTIVYTTKVDDTDLDALMPKVARYGAALYDGEDAPTLARILQER